MIRRKALATIGTISSAIAGCLSLGDTTARSADSASAELAIRRLDRPSRKAMLQINPQPTENERIAVLERDVAGKESMSWSNSWDQLGITEMEVQSGSLIVVFAADPDGGFRELERHRVVVENDDERIEPASDSGGDSVE